MSDQTELEISIEAAQAKVKVKDDMLKLQKNPLFKKVIMQGYLKDYTLGLVMFKASPPAASEQAQTRIEAELTGVSRFNNFMTMGINEGLRAETDLQLHEEELEAELSEDRE